MTDTVRLDWDMRGTVVYRGGEISAIEASWPDLTCEQANARAQAVVKGFMGKRKVFGISVTASARTTDTKINATIVLMESKQK